MNKIHPFGFDLFAFFLIGVFIIFLSSTWYMTLIGILTIFASEVIDIWVSLYTKKHNIDWNKE